jgi:beta-glucanase (GH16 family)
MYQDDLNLCNSGPYTLVFEDDFSGNSLDPSKWTPATGVKRNCGKERQWYSPENVLVSNGTLKLIAKKEPVPVTGWNPCTEASEDFEYTSGEIESKFSFSYGIFEARIKIPTGMGYWPAFWTYGDGLDGVNNEIDIFEFMNDDSGEHVMTVYYNGQMHQTDYKDWVFLPFIHPVSFAGDYHIFRLVWEPDRIEWYVDGELRRRDSRYYELSGQEAGCTINANTPYVENTIFTEDPMSILLNVALQSGEYAPDNSTSFPGKMEVDWVRYYTKCRSIDITDISQSTVINTWRYNIIVGSDVNINCNFEIPAQHQLEVIAENSIILRPGFHANEGSTTSAKIDPTVCGNSLEGGRIENNSFDSTKASLTTIQKITDNIELRVFPNPNKGIFEIIFNDNDFDNYSIKVINQMGSEVFSMEKLLSNFSKIDISNNSKGVYILYLINTKSNVAYQNKIVIQ